MLAHDRRHAFGPWVFAAAAAYFLLHLYNILYMLNEPENPAILVWRFSGSMGLVPDAMPLVAALPAAAAFAVDWNSGFAVPAVLRAGTGRYLRSKVLAACIGGGLAPLLGRLAFVVFLHILYRGDVAIAAEMFGSDGAIDYYMANGGFEMALITDDGRVLITPGLIDSFELANLDYTVEMIR